MQSILYKAALFLTTAIVKQCQVDICNDTFNSSLAIDARMACSNRTLYFGFGSNLWLEQTAQRCPESIFEGIGILNDWKWIINARGYANVVQSPGDLVYGMCYSLSPTDEARLDVNEGVPFAYVKKMLQVDFIQENRETITNETDYVSQMPVLSNQLVYIDFNNTTPDSPKQEYIYRINMGVKDALSKGIPQWYIDKYIRPFIPEQGQKSLKRAHPRVALDRTEGEL